MAGQVHLPHGTTLSFASTSVGGLLSVTLPDESKGDVETTDHGDAFQRTYIPGLREGGTITVNCRRIPANAGQAALRTNYAANRTLEEVVITLPAEANDDSDVTTFTFDGYVNALGGDDLPADEDTTTMFSATIKVAGAVTEATA